VEAESAFVEIRMSQSVQNADTLVWIEDEHLAKKMDGLVCSLR
jgi:hypothetical protein